MSVIKTPAYAGLITGSKLAMKNRIIAVANLGAFRAYRILQEGHNTPRLIEVATADAPNEHTKRSNTLTVMEGKSGGTAGNPKASATASDGEQHNMELEKRRRAVKKIAELVTKLIEPDPEVTCALAAPKEILGQVLSEIHPSLRTRIDKNVPLDLTHYTKAELVAQFCPRPAQPAAAAGSKPAPLR